MVVRLTDKHVNPRAHISTKMKLRFILILPEVDTLAINRQYHTAYNMYHAVHNMQHTITYIHIYCKAILQRLNDPKLECGTIRILIDL